MWPLITQSQLKLLKVEKCKDTYALVATSLPVDFEVAARLGVRMKSCIPSVRPTCKVWVVRAFHRFNAIDASDDGVAVPAIWGSLIALAVDHDEVECAVGSNERNESNRSEEETHAVMVVKFEGYG